MRCTDTSGFKSFHRFTMLQKLPADKSRSAKYFKIFLGRRRQLYLSKPSSHWIHDEMPFCSNQMSHREQDTP